MKASLSIALFFSFSIVVGQSLSEEYLQAWKEYYPSKALNAGIRPSVFSYENRTMQTIKRWITYNESVLEKVSKSGSQSNINRINARLLRVQAQSEIDQWNELKVHESDLRLYLRLLNDAISPIYEAGFLTTVEKGQLVCNRLLSMVQLAQAARENLKFVSREDLEKSDQAFDDLQTSLRSLPEALKANGIYQSCEKFNTHLKIAQVALDELATYISKTLSKSIKESSDILGREEYARQLALYTDSDLTPEKLAEMALQEIELVRRLMDEVASAYLKKTYAESPLPESFEERLDKALHDMGSDVPLNSKDYEVFWQELADRAIAFVGEKGLGTLPENLTLSIKSAPESAGPAARIGWVGVAPPFDPNPWTTLYLPSIPDTLPEQEQKDFWSSFNKPFNRIIVIHELFPGHYMQLKISRETPHRIRSLFPYGPYVEGWATFCERVALDEGWDAGNDMTMLAHLRKRIENANRAYTSVMVHTQGWTQEQVMQFSTETCLVAPQFAKSLWYRLMRSPMQLTSYYYGGAQFSELMESEKNRLGDQFDLTLFMDSIMKAGAIPIDEFQSMFIETISQ